MKKYQFLILIFCAFTISTNAQYKYKGGNASGDASLAIYNQSLSVTTDIIRIKSNLIRIYPSPFKDNIYIENLGGITYNSCTLTDIKGNTIKIYNYLPDVLDLSFLKQGVYFLKTDKWIRKIIKN